MAIKYQTITHDHSCPSFLLQAIRDFLVTDCGWTDNTPVGQDDDFNFGLGHFLESNGEDGLAKLHMHVWANEGHTANTPPKMSYLSTIIFAGNMSCVVLDGTLFPAVGPFWIRINDELITCSGTSGNTITFSLRGAGGTTPATHSPDACVGVTDETYCDIEMFAHQDMSNSILAASGVATLTRTSAPTVPGLIGYGARRFNYHSFLKITSGAETGKMRPITDYADAGNFTVRPFLNAPGSSTCEIVTDGFNPACSKRMCDANFTNTMMHWGHVQRNTVGNATTYFMYGSKDGLLLISKFGGNYSTAYFGNVVPFASKLTTTLTAPVAAAAISIVVANRHLFIVGEKFRLLSTDVDDWADNEDRSAESPAGNWPDLDPEEVPSEEVVVSAITPGAGDTGTIGISALTYSYRTGAVIGEDPRPSVRSVRYGSTFKDLLKGTDTVLPLYLCTEKISIAAHASHRQVIRAYHFTNKWDPYSALFLNCVLSAAKDVGAAGEYNLSATNEDAPSYLNDRYVGGMLSVSIPSTSSTYGLYRQVRGTIPLVWWFDVPSVNSPYGGAEEDTLKAWWGSQYETFRLYKSPDGFWFTCGPEIP